MRKNGHGKNAINDKINTVIIAPLTSKGKNYPYKLLIPCIVGVGEAKPKALAYQTDNRLAINDPVGETYLNKKVDKSSQMCIAN
jgi:hypothetical protein